MIENMKELKENMRGRTPATEAEKEAKIRSLEKIANNPEESAEDRAAAFRLLDQLRGTAHDGPWGA